MSETQAAELLAQLARRITASLDLRETLQVVAQAVVDQLGFGAAVVNLCQPGDLCEVAAVAGPDEVGQALLGTRAPMANFRRLLDGCEPWGELRFLDHRKDNGLSRGVAAWSPPGETRDEPDAWHPEDILLAPLYAPDQTLIGVLSVDIPVDGRRPGPARRRLLEQFAAHAALAIEHCRGHRARAAARRRPPPPPPRLADRPPRGPPAGRRLGAAVPDDVRLLADRD